jgi:drug/metabolite transporter (DMT)-like permease
MNDSATPASITRPTRPAATATFAVLLLALLWGMNWPAVRIALNGFAPWTFRAAGLTAGGLLLLAIAIARSQPLAVPAGQRLRLMVAGVLNIAGFNLFTTFAQLSGSTSRAAIITFTMPMWAVLFAWLALDERPDRRRVAAIVLGCCGLALLVAPLFAVRPLQLAGAGYALGAGISWAAGTVFLKRHPISAAPFAVAGWQLLIGAAVAAGGMAMFEPAPSLSGIGWQPWVAFGYHAVLAVALAYFIWFEVVAQLPASVASLGTLLIPVVGVLGAVLVLGERPDASDLLGFAAIGAAAWAALRAPAAQTRPSPPPRAGT